MKPKMKKQDTVFKYGRMAANTRAFGKTTWLRILDDLFWQMVTSTSDIGMKIRLTEKEIITMQREPCTKVAGLTTNKKVKVTKHGLTALST